MISWETYRDAHRTVCAKCQAQPGLLMANGCARVVDRAWREFLLRVRQVELRSQQRKEKS